MFLNQRGQAEGTNFPRLLRSEKAQAFSVFQLLISAVVALAILGILFSVLGQIGGGFIGEKPNNAAGKLIQDLATTRSLIKSTGVVIFNRSEPQLFVKAISEASKGQVAPDQICLYAGDFVDNDFFKDSTTKVLKYSGSADKKAKIKGICDTGDELESSINEQDSEFAEWFGSGCDCAEGRKTCCFLALLES